MGVGTLELYANGQVVIRESGPFAPVNALQALDRLVVRAESGEGREASVPWEVVCTTAKITGSRIKAALSARDKATRAESKHRTAMQARLQAGRRQGERALTSYLKKTGFDFEAFDKIRAQQQAEMHRLLKEAETAATKTVYHTREGSGVQRCDLAQDDRALSRRHPHVPIRTCV
jgi:hypothetical protein